LASVAQHPGPPGDRTRDHFCFPLAHEGVDSVYSSTINRIRNSYLMQFSDLPSILLVVFMHVVVDCAAANYFSCTTSAYCAHRNAGSTPMTYGYDPIIMGYIIQSSNAPSYFWICTIFPRRDSPVGPVTHPLAPWQPSCARSLIGGSIVNVCCNHPVGGVDPTKPEKVVTVAIYDFDTKFQCREAPNSA
ncbi:hypothetical protein PSTT_03362, partial [Puccinia striiformis]